jgi:hypothetical protein
MRRNCRPARRAAISRQCNALEVAARRHGRLIPPVPFGVFNYAAGEARISFPDYLAGTAIGIIPYPLAALFASERASGRWLPCAGHDNTTLLLTRSPQAACSRDTAVGSERWNVVLFPGTLSAQSRPPCASMIPFEM